MKKLVLWMLINIIFIDLGAQNFEWVKREGLWAYDYGFGITTDKLNNVYVVGKYEMKANFSGTILPNQGNHDIFVAKYTSAGVLSWIRTAGGVLGDYATSVACDGSNFLYVTGEIEGTNVDVSFVGTSTVLNCVSDNDIFLAKYDLSGNLLWAKQAGWWHNEKANAITYDNFGNVYICGYFNDTTYFSSTVAYSAGMKDIFIAKYDKNGDFVWVRTAGSTGRDEAKSMQCDAAGNIYICGLFSGNATFGSQTNIQTIASANGYYDSFLAKYDSNGALLWVKRAGGDYDEVGWALTIDNIGKIYVAGEFNASADFDAVTLHTAGQADVFVACYDASGNIEWVKRAGGDLVDKARGIGCDGSNIYITGQFGYTASFGPHNIIASDTSDIFISRLNNRGDFMWAISVGGQVDLPEPLGYESGNAVCAHPTGYVYATGTILDGGVFGSMSVDEYDRTDIFIAKLSQTDVSITAINKVDGIKIYPNPNSGSFTIELDQLPSQPIETTVYNSLGEIIEKTIHGSVSKINIDLSARKKGIYLVEIRDGQKTGRAEVILQ